MDKSMEIGTTRLRVKDTSYSRKGNANWNGHVVRMDTYIIGDGLSDPFFKGPHEELLTCSDILHGIAFSDRSKGYITVTFDKNFLKKIIKSHMHFIS